MEPAINVLERELSLLESRDPDCCRDLKEQSLFLATEQGLDPDVMKKLLGL
jgi:hypothetical protein